MPVVNASDNKQRDPNMSTLKVEIDPYVAHSGTDVDPSLCDHETMSDATSYLVLLQDFYFGTALAIPFPWKTMAVEFPL